MLVDFGTYKIKKYAHTLVVDSLHEQKKIKSSRILTSTSSKNSKDKQINKNIEQIKKTTRNRSFSPQLSLERYRMKQKVLNIPNIRRSSNNQVKLLISTIKQNQTIQRKCYTPSRQPHKDIQVCAHCQSRSKNKTCRYYKLPFAQQNISDYKIQGCGEFQLSQLSIVDHSDKIISLTHRVSARRSLKPAKKVLKSHGLDLKPWDLSQSLSEEVI